MASPARATVFYREGNFPRTLQVNGVNLPVKVNSEYVMIGCTSISKSVMESLVAEMESATQPEEE